MRLPSSPCSVWRVVIQAGRVPASWEQLGGVGDALAVGDQGLDVAEHLVEQLRAGGPQIG